MAHTDSRQHRSRQREDNSGRRGAETELPLHGWTRERQVISLRKKLAEVRV